MVRGAKALRAATSSASFMQYMYRYNFETRNIYVYRYNFTAVQGQRSGVVLCGTKPCHSSGNNAVDQKRWELVKNMGDKSSDMVAGQRSI